VTDIANGGTECESFLVRIKMVLTTALTELRKTAAVSLWGFDTDNDGVFMSG
jgi:hypothetical protein